MPVFETWPQLLHVNTQRAFPLCLNGTTTFGRSPHFYNYSLKGSVRWSPELAESLPKGHHVWISDDTHVSRTHGKITHFPDSNTLLYQDLRSRNGSQLNFEALRVTEGTMRLASSYRQRDDLPTVCLSHGDILSIGGENFAIELLDSPRLILAGKRNALLIEGASGNSSETLRPCLELLDRKGFDNKRVRVLDANEAEFASRYEQAFDSLSHAASADGFVVIVLRGQVEGEQIRLGPDFAESPVRLLRRLDQIPGAKALIIVSDEAPRRFEDAFNRFAYCDTLFVSQTGLAPAQLSELANSQAGSARTPGTTTEDHVGVLDALLSADLPQLQVDNLEPFLHKTNGRIKLVLGAEIRPLESYGGISNSMDFKLGSSLACSVQVRRSQTPSPP